MNHIDHDKVKQLKNSLVALVVVLVLVAFCFHIEKKLRVYVVVLVGTVD